MSGLSKEGQVSKSKTINKCRLMTSDFQSIQLNSEEERQVELIHHVLLHPTMHGAVGRHI